jgi:hypothetical protein
MFGRTLIAALFATSLAGGSLIALQQPFPPGLSLRIATPTYYANGKIGGASGGNYGGLLKMNQPFVLYVYSGRTLCASASPDVDMPTDAGYGWRLEITPLRQSNGIVMQVNW